MRLLTAVVVGVALIAAVTLGAWRFPLALEPTGGERARIVLNDLVDHGQGSVANDWFRVSAAASIVSSGAGLQLIAPARANAELEVASRSLPVLPHECYALTMRARVIRPGAAGAVVDENMIDRIRAFSFSTKGTRTVRVLFPSGGERRVTLVLFGSRRSNVLLHKVVLARLHAGCV